MENVDDDVHIVQQRPSPRGHSLNMVGAAPCSVNRLQHVLGQCPDMHMRGTGRDHEKVSGVTDLSQVQDHDLERLVCFQRTDSEPEFSARVAPYAIVSSSAGNCSAASEGAASSTW